MRKISLLALSALFLVSACGVPSTTRATVKASKTAVKVGTTATKLAVRAVTPKRCGRRDRDCDR